MGKRPLLINNNAETLFLMNISRHRDAPVRQFYVLFCRVRDVSVERAVVEAKK